MLKLLTGLLTIFSLLSIDLNVGHASERKKLTAREYHYYDIHGSSAKELRSQMDELGKLHPPVEGREKSWGYTKREKFEKDDCAKFYIINRYYLPRWVNREDGSVLLRAEWNRMFTNLWLHELGHGFINNVAAIKHFATKCRHWEKINNRRIRQSEFYDKVTDHGYWTGVFLLNSK